MCEGQNKCDFRKKVEEMAQCKSDCKQTGHHECWKDNCDCICHVARRVLDTALPKSYTPILEEEKIKYKARYREKGVNPFELRFPENAFCSITSDEMPKDTPIKEIEKFAKENTPDGYEFIEVIPIEDA